MTLTPGAKRLNKERVFASFIVESKEGRFDKTIEAVEQLDLISSASNKTVSGLNNDLNNRNGVLDQVRPGVIFSKGTNYGPLGYPQRRLMDNLNMVSSYFGRNELMQLSNENSVRKIYSDKLDHALYSTVPSDSAYEYQTRGSSYNFTDTKSTKEMLGINEVFTVNGYKGAGIKVSVPDTAGKNKEQQVSHQRFTSVMAQQVDRNGHGVWCTSCVGGKSMRDKRISNRVGSDVVNEGMAVNSDVLGIKCLGHVLGTGNRSAVLSSIDKSISWGADIISMSLGNQTDSSNIEDDPYYSAMNKALDEGIVPVVAAGNSGSKENTITTPGWLPNVLTVGAYNPITGKIAGFSSRGPTNDGRTKPDIVAPGVNIDSGAVGMLDATKDKLASTSAAISGTSMATPHVAGMLACAMDRWRSEFGTDLTMQDVKNIATAKSNKKTNTEGWGELTASDLSTPT